MYGKRGRIFAGALALVLIFSSGGISAFADGAQGQAYEAASGGSAEAGGEIRNSDGEDAGTGPEDVQGAETALEPEDAQDTETALVPEDAQGTETAPGPEDTATSAESEGSGVTEDPEEAGLAEISDWGWIDEEGVLQNADGRWILTVPGAGGENPATRESLLDMLPARISAVTPEGDSLTLDILWDVSSIPEAGMTDGTYTISADISGEYCLGEEAAPLEVTVEGTGAETLTLPTGPLEDAALKEYIVENNADTSGTTINLFDYWLYERETNDGSDGGNVSDKGINAGHALNFRKEGGNDYPGEWNDYTGTGNGPYQGIVANRIGEDGYPRLNDLDTGWHGRDGEESLRYLFDPDYEHKGKIAYADVDGLLQVDNEGYYYYDSEKNYAAFYPGSNAFALYKKAGLPYHNGDKLITSGQFFPFNAATDAFNEWWGDIWDNGTSYNGKNHYFGVTMSTRFIQQYGGHTSPDQSKAVTYEFSGDDDVWVFIDDVLVADLGGIHDKASLSINFQTGKIYIQGKSAGTLLDKFEAADKDTSGFAGKTFADDTYHTLKFYYLERGNTASNMSLKFNLVTVPESDVIKVDQLGDPVPGAVFDLYKANCSYMTDGEAVASGTTDSSGSFILVDKDGYTVSLNDLYERGVKYLVLRERTVPQGYRSAGEMHLYMYEKNGNIVLLSANHWDTGSYASAKLTAKAPNQVVEKYPISDGEGTMFAVVMKYVGSGNPDPNSLDDWRPVSGDPVKDGWHVAESSGMESILAAAKANPYLFQIDSSGAYKAEIENMPGDIRNYYFMQDSGNASQDKPMFTVMYFYAEGTGSLEAIGSAEDIVHIEENAWTEFSREFAARLYVPNIKNQLLVQKVDEQGNPVEGAEFTLYSEYPHTGSKPEVKDRLITRNLSKENQDPIDLAGGGIFPTEEAGNVLPSGTYYLVETDAPDGYKRNETVTKIIVDSTGVYADAGNDSDGVDVLRGVGSIVKTMAQFAADDGVDTTLHDIRAKLLKSTTDLPDADGTQWEGLGDETHLQYQAAGAALEYGPEATAGGTVYPLTLRASSGWTRLAIRQCLDHDSGEIEKLKEELGDRDLTALFSGTVTVQVTNERVGSLTVSKKVVDEMSAAPDDEEFTFTLTGTINGVALQGPYRTSESPGNGNPQSGKVEFDSSGKAEIRLQDGESITILELPEGAEITAAEAEKEGYSTAYDTGDGGFQNGNETEPLTITNTGSVSVKFVNTYEPVSGFSFQKTDAQDRGLGGARFALYELVCENSEHKHFDDLLVIDGKGIITGVTNGEETCWKAAGTGAGSAEETGLVSFDGLEISSEYRLVEYMAPGGYVPPKGQWILTYDKDKKAFGISGSVKAAVTPAFEYVKEGIPIEGTEKVFYRVRNYEPGELPFSGNIGTRLFLVMGGVLMAVGISGGVWWYVNRRKRAGGSP